MKRFLLLAAMSLPIAGFADDLSAVYQQALKNDTTLRIAQSNRDANRETLPIAEADLLPTISGSADASYAFQDVDSRTSGKFDQNYDSQSLNVSLTYPLYSQANKSTVEQAEYILQQADANYEAAKQDLALRTAKAYFSILAAQDNVVFAESEKAAIERQLDQAQQRFDVGLVAITDVHEAQARYDQARADEIVAINNLDDAEEALREIIGQLPNSFSALKIDVPLLPPNPSDQEAWSSAALKQNPDILAAQHQMEAAREEIAIQRAANDFTVDLVAGYDISRSDSTLSADTDTASVAVKLAKPFYTGGGVEAATRRAQHQYQSAVDTLDQQRRSVEKTVRNSYRGVMSSISRVKALEASQHSAQSALEATEAGFDVGTRTLVDVLNGQRDLFRARRDFSQSRYDYILNTLTLFQAAGALGEEDIQRVNSWLK